MRLLEKYKTIEEAAENCRSRFSVKAEQYCYKRYVRANRREYELFWLNMSYLYGLMKTPERPRNE